MTIIVSIIVMYNDIENVGYLIEKINNQSVSSSKLVLIDNSDKIVYSDNEIFELGFLGEVHYIKLKHNLGSSFGFSFAQSYSLKTFHKDFYLWIHDSDGYPEIKCLEKLTKNNEKKILLPSIYDTEDKKYKIGVSRRFINKLGFIYNDNYINLKKINLFASSGILIHSKILNKFGCYDYENFFVNLEDYEYSLRVSKEDINSISFIKDAVYYHPMHNRTSKYTLESIPFVSFYLGEYSKNKSARNRYYSFSASYILGKHFNISQMITSLSYSIFRVIINKIRGKDIDLIQTLKIYYAGILNGMKNSTENNNSLYMNDTFVEKKYILKENES